MKWLPEHMVDALGHAPADKRLDILQRIGHAGSISQAARDAGVSYKAAWQAIETLSSLAGRPVVEKAVGGSGGGGARLTLAGRQLLQAAGRLHAARHAALAAASGALDPPALGALTLRTSMRNALPGTVRRIEPVAGAALAHLLLPGDQRLSARITRESAQLLGLRKGLDVLALCKATAVQVRAAPPTVPTRDRTNRITGCVVRLPPKGRAGEAWLALAGGQLLVGFLDEPGGLSKGDEAVAWVDAAAVVIALPG